MDRKYNLCPPVEQWLSQIRSSEPVLMGGAAVVTGLLSGVGVWVFKQLIAIFQTVVENLPASLGSWNSLLTPAVGGLIVGWLLFTFIKTERYSGVSGIIEAAALGGGKLRFWRMPVKIVAAALSIGVGASVGPEDPSVQIGANVGSLFGQRLRLSDDQMRTLLASGAAGGIAAAFNAPIAGVFFALEVILGELSSHSFSFAAIAAVVSAAFTQAVLGTDPAFQIPQYSLGSALELPLFLGLGILAGPVAAIYVKLIFTARGVFQNWAIPAWVKPAIAGLMVGFVALYLPQIKGVGYAAIEGILKGESFGVTLLLLLLVAKGIITPVSIGGGFMGGVFAPALFLGATLGGAYGQFSALIFPGLGLHPPAFALVGMAAVLAGTVHAPLTAIILLFEMTNDYRIILPLMFAVSVSLWISRQIETESVYTLPLAKNGIHLKGGRDVEILEGITVAEVMQTLFPVLQESDPIEAISAQISATHWRGFPVVDRNDRLIGLVALQDLETAQVGKTGYPTVGDICSRDLVIAYPDETIDMALRRMSGRGIGRLPVVSREDPSQLKGMLRRSDIFKAYEIALARRTILRHRLHEARLGTVGNVSVQDVLVRSGSFCAGKKIGSLPWPKDSLIATIRRGNRVILPHGDTSIKTGDVLVIVTEGGDLNPVENLVNYVEETPR